jgi:Undecaprenyl-phosphate galactose phosphotransferase WbaP
MSEIGAIAPHQAASKARLGGWQRVSTPNLRRFRKSFVAGSLIAGDLLSAQAALWCSDTLASVAGLSLGDSRPLSIVVLILAFAVARLYSGFGPGRYERLRSRAICVAVFVTLDVVARPLSPGLPALFLVEAGSAVCLVIFGYYTEAAIRAVMIRAGLWGARAAVIASGEEGHRLATLLAERQDLGLLPIGFIQTPENADLQRSQTGLPQVGTTADPRSIDPEVEIVLAGSTRDLAAFVDGSGQSTSHRLLLVQNLGDMQSLWLRTRELGETAAIEIRRDLCQPHNRLVKRVIDLVLGIALGLLAVPVVTILALAIRCIDRGPVFYVQSRVGRNGEAVRVLKLRTMYADAEQRLEEHLRHDPQARKQWERFFKLDKDPRILPVVGDFMRRKSLDELPQLWNVIRGDMSLVGPRPFPSYHMNSFDAEFQAIRTSVPPGITGMWQISSRSNGDLDVQKAQDLFYIRNWSLWLDIYILLETVPTVLSSKGAR